jgi:CBS domain containing-hemolysin-like protein
MNLAQVFPLELVSGLLTVTLLIAMNAFFAVTEFSVLSVRQSRIQQLIREGDRPAKTVQQLQQNLVPLLSTTQLGITLSSLALGWIGEKAIAKTLTDWLTRTQNLTYGQQILVQGISILIAFWGIAYLQIILGELCPKMVAINYAESLSRRLAPISLRLIQLFSPLLWLLDQSNRFLLNCLRLSVQQQSFDAVNLSVPEIRLLLERVHGTQGNLEYERDFLNHIFEAKQLTVRDCMVPRLNIQAIADQATVADLRAEYVRTGHRFYPVIHESLDQVRGMVITQTVLRSLSEAETVSIHPYVESAWFISEELSIFPTLRWMEKYQLSVAMVREENSSGTAGLITRDDLIAAILGMTVPGTEQPKTAITYQNPQTVIIQAQTELERINQEVGIDLPITEAYQTLGGFLLYQWQKVPSSGEKLQFQDLEFTVLSLRGARIDQVQISSVRNFSIPWQQSP